MKRNRKFWRALETLADGATLADWKLELGGEFERARRFLVETQQQAASYPCMAPNRCECRWHRVEDLPNGQHVSACDCGECPPMPVTATDLVVYELNKPDLAEAVAQVCGWTVARDDNDVSPWRLGRWEDLRADLFWCCCAGRERTRKILYSLLGAGSAPFILLFPTAVNLSSRLDAGLKREGCLPLALDDYLAVDSDGKLNLIKSLETLRQEFLERSAKLDTAKILRSINEQFKVFGAEHQELRRTKDRLEKMQAEGLMKFTAKVDGKSFHVLCGIIACGDVAKASRALKMGDSTVRDVINSWKKLGPSYAVMIDLVRWRKRVGGKYTVPFNDKLLYEKDATAAGHETVFSDLLDAVLSMTESNWPDICAELESALKKQLAK